MLLSGKIHKISIEKFTQQLIQDLEKIRSFFSIESTTRLYHNISASLSNM